MRKTVHPENEYEVRILMRSQIREVYNRNLTGDFPPDERKPLSIIETALDQGRYICYGYFSGEKMAAYAFFAKEGKNVLVDYFAVKSSLRDQGLGSRFLQALIDGPLQGPDCALLEVDDPDYAADPQAQEICKLRLRFYLRNGLKDTGARSAINHVNYMVLALPVGNEPVGGEALSIYLSIYGAIPFKIIKEKKLQIEGWVVG